MNALIHMYDTLSIALTHDPLLLLATTVATFDPYWNTLDDDDYDYETDGLVIALHVTRGLFPDIYAEAVDALRRGATYAQMDDLVCKAFSARGIPLLDLESIGWGIPMSAVGVDLEDPDFYTVHAELLPILAPFGILPADGTTYDISLPETVYAVGRAMASSLEAQTDSKLKQVGWLFGWLFNCTGNSLVDNTDALLAEIPPLSWTPDDIDFGVELIQEADVIMADVRAGIETFNTTPAFRAVLERHVNALYRKLKTKGKLDERHLHLDWTGALGGAE